MGKSDCATHRHDDNQAGGDIGVEQVVSQSPLEDKHDFQAGKVPCRVDLGTISCLIAYHRQLGKFDLIVDDQRLLGIPLKDQIIGCVGH